MISILFRITGEIDRAETYFKTVHNSANASKKEYMFGALVGLVSLALQVVDNIHGFFYNSKSKYDISAGHRCVLEGQVRTSSGALQQGAAETSQVSLLHQGGHRQLLLQAQAV